MQCINGQVKGEVRDQVAGGYIRGTTYLRTPLFWMIPVVTLFVVCAGAVYIAVKPEVVINCIMQHSHAHL